MDDSGEQRDDVQVPDGEVGEEIKVAFKFCQRPFVTAVLRGFLSVREALFFNRLRPSLCERI